MSIWLSPHVNKIWEGSDYHNILLIIIYDRLWASVMKSVPNFDKSESGLIVLKKVKLTYFDELIIYDNHLMIIIDLLLICYWSTNTQKTEKVTNQQIHNQTNKQTNLNMMITWWSCDYHNMIILCSYNDHLLIIWI